MIRTKRAKLAALCLLMHSQVSLAPKIEATLEEKTCTRALKNKDILLVKQCLEGKNICLTKPLKQANTLLHEAVFSHNEELIQLVFEKAGVKDKKTLLQLHSYQNIQKVSPLQNLKLLSNLIKLENPIIKQYVVWIQEDAIKKFAHKIMSIIQRNAATDELEKQLKIIDSAALTEIIEPTTNSTLLHWVLASQNSTAIKTVFRYAIDTNKDALDKKNSFQLSPFEMMAMLATKNRSSLENYIKELQNVGSE